MNLSIDITSSQIVNKNSTKHIFLLIKNFVCVQIALEQAIPLSLSFRALASGGKSSTVKQN